MSTKPGAIQSYYPGKGTMLRCLGVAEYEALAKVADRLRLTWIEVPDEIEDSWVRLNRQTVAYLSELGATSN